MIINMVRRMISICRVAVTDITLRHIYRNYILLALNTIFTVTFFIKLVANT